MTELELDLRASGDGVTLRVRVQPRSSRDALVGSREGALVVKLTAPPVEGAANAALVHFLAAQVGRPPSAITVLHGAKGRDKTVHMAGVDITTARERLQGKRSK